MVQRNLFIWNNSATTQIYTRITIGTAPEMEQFQTAWQKVMTGAATASVGAVSNPRRRNLDGIVVRA
jgi:hypothetical protein